MKDIKNVSRIASNAAGNEKMKDLYSYNTINYQSCKEITVQYIVDKIRQHETCTGQKWLGTKKSGDAIECRYPNLAAEILARKHFLWYPASIMNVTEELLCDVLESGEDLNLDESQSICELWGLSFDYLFSEKLATIQIDGGEYITVAQYAKWMRDVLENQREPIQAPRGRAIL